MSHHGGDSDVHGAEVDGLAPDGAGRDGTSRRHRHRRADPDAAAATTVIHCGELVALGSYQYHRSKLAILMLAGSFKHEDLELGRAIVARCSLACCSGVSWLLTCCCEISSGP